MVFGLLPDTGLRSESDSALVIIIQFVSIALESIVLLSGTLDASTNISLD